MLVFSWYAGQFLTKIFKHEFYNPENMKRFRAAFENEPTVTKNLYVTYAIHF